MLYPFLFLEIDYWNILILVKSMVPLYAMSGGDIISVITLIVFLVKFCKLRYFQIYVLQYENCSKFLQVHH